MKKTYILLTTLLITTFLYAQEPFITTWQIDDGGEINFPIVEDDDIPDSYTIDFGDGTVLTNQSGVSYHVYDSPGIYTITVSGNFSRIKFPGIFTFGNLLTIEQWGDVQWTSMDSAFAGCSYLTSINAQDIPDLSQVTDTSLMFFNCSSFNSDINNWNVSNITNMGNMFFRCNNFNQPLNNWDVSNVTNMVDMFEEATSFNQPLNNWDVSSVTNMESMFYHASSFNQPLNNWDVSNVTNMESMFYHASSFNQSLNNWDVSSVTNMESMFYHASSFNQPLDNWDVSNVTNMLEMFYKASTFNESLNNWDTSNLTDIKGMFREASSFNQPLDNWNVSNITNMAFLFSEATSFNQSIDNWDVSNVTNMSFMFQEATSFNQPLNNWNLSSLDSMLQMFTSATSFNQPLNNWEVSSVTNMQAVFLYATSFNQDLSSWHFNNVQFSIFSPSFISYSGLDTDNYDALLNRFAQLGLEDRQLGAHTLHFCDYGVRSYLVSELGWLINDSGPSDNCGNNTLSGTVLFDENNDGCDIDDFSITNFMVSGSNGTYNYSTTINSNGVYNLNLFEDTYEVTLLNIPNYFSVTPETTTVTFTEEENEQELNFCLTATENIKDLNITLLPIDDARPGFESNYQLVVENIGTQTVANAIVTLIFDETLQTFVTAIPAATAITTNQLTFNVENILPFENRIIEFTMQTFEPPTVNGGEIVEFTAVVTPADNDNTPDDNTFVIEQEIVNSYDPNDKRVVQGEEILIEQASEYLDYIIRFQNTGTASAITVRIEDVLSEDLDWTTFKPISASHDYAVQITDGNQLEFIFNDINLPHEAADEPGSHGYIAYKIKPITGLQVGDVINGNEAGIYFDYNLPIITNTTTTEIVDPTAATDSFLLNNQLSLYPNPVKDILHIEVKSGVQLEEVKVYNLQGSQLLQLNRNLESINTESLSSGIYLLSIKTDKGSVEYKLIKN